MTLALDSGCESPSPQVVADIYRLLAEHYAPTLAFDHRERFFPVDLDAVARAAKLYAVTGVVEDGREILRPQDERFHQEVVGAVFPDFLIDSERRHFLSLVPWQKEVARHAQPPYFMPVPAPPTLIHARFAGPQADIDARLTMYATVCRPTDVVNFTLLTGGGLANPLVAASLDAGLLINYYFYFPALEYDPSAPGAPVSWLLREGDWTGISLLVDRVPPAGKPEAAQPVLLAYYKKARDLLIDDREYFVTGPGGFVTPKDATWFPGKIFGDQSPLVLISRGRHNCYPHHGQHGTQMSWSCPQGSPWRGSSPDPEKINSGAYNKASPDIRGADQEDETLALLGLLFPPLLVFACPTSGGARPRVHHDSSPDVNNNIGFELPPVGAKPGATDSTYPKEGGLSALVGRCVNLIYVDTNAAGIRNLWGYRGSWGSSERVAFPFTYEGETAEQVVISGRFGGAWRPNLAAWFTWNLFHDPVHGLGGGGGTGYY